MQAITKQYQQMVGLYRNNKAQIKANDVVS